MTDLTIILPHRRNPGNDAALRIALDCLYTNTVNDFILICDAAYDQPLYERVNRMVQQATTERCVYWCSDLFAARAWDTPMLEKWNPQTIVTNIVVEPGVIGIDPRNVGKDFGRRPENYRRAEFGTWASSPDAPVPDGIGFPAPYMFPRTLYLEYGGLELGLPGDHHGFTNADTALFDRWRFAGKSIVRAKSYVYHLQRYSELDEQQHKKREMVSP